jgi:hypothetical protein
MGPLSTPSNDIFYSFVVYLVTFFSNSVIQSEMKGRSMINCKKFERKQLWPNFKVQFQHSPGMTEENHEKPQLRDLVSGPRCGPRRYMGEYEAVVQKF